MAENFDPIAFYGLRDILRAVEIKFKIKFDPKDRINTSFSIELIQFIKHRSLIYVGIYQKAISTKGHAVFMSFKD